MTANNIPQPDQCQLYADDLNVSITTADPHLVQSLMQQTLKNFEIWSSSTELEFSLEKSKETLFTRKNTTYTQN